MAPSLRSKVNEILGIFTNIYNSLRSQCKYNVINNCCRYFIVTLYENIISRSSSHIHVTLILDHTVFSAASVCVSVCSSDSFVSL